MSHESVTPVRVLVVQDHPLLASAIARVLDNEEDMTVIGIARRGDEAATLAAEQKPSVVLMDFRLPDLSGPAAAAKIRTAAPTAAIVFHSAEESEDALLDAIDAGAIAYLTKAATADEIIEAVRKASVGEVLIPVGLFAKAIARQRRVGNEKQAREKLLAEFTPRELDVLRLLARGLSNAEIAGTLFVSQGTVKTHVTRILAKLALRDRVQAAVLAYETGLVRPGAAGGPSTRQPS